MRSIGEHGGSSVVWAPVLVLIGSLLEGVGVLLLVPLLTVLAGGGTAPAWLARRLAMVPAAKEALAPLLLGGVLLLVVLRSVVLWHRDQVTYRLALATVDGWRARIVRSLADADWPRLSALRHNRIEHAVTTDVTRLAGGGDQLIRSGSALLQIAVQGGFALLLSPRLTILALVVPLALLPLLRGIALAGDHHGREMTKGGWQRHDIFSTFLAGLKLAKSHDLEERYASQFVAAGLRLQRQALDFNGARLRLVHSFTVAGAVTAILLVAVGLYWMHVPVAVLTALLVLLARLSGPTAQLAQGVQALGTLVPVVSDLLDLMDGLNSTRPTFTTTSVAHQTGPASVTLEKVHHGSDRMNPLLNIHLTIAAGQAVALIGASGAGKTTLADIIVGLTPPEAGSLVVDGAAILDEAARRSWRAQTAYVPQDPMLFDMSLLDNLRWAAPDATEEEVWSALDVVGAAPLVRGLPDGLRTRAGHRGTHLSGGERQRLCLARALLKRPRLLLLDEATSALDPPSELTLMERLRMSSNATLLVIAHRPPPAFIDRILVLEDGRITEAPVASGNQI